MAKYQKFGEQKSFQGQSSVKGESQSLLYPNVVELGGLSKTMKDKALRLPSVVDSDIMLKLLSLPREGEMESKLLLHHLR